MKKKIGIWLDYKTASFITVGEHDSNIEHMESDVEFSRLGGGARSKQPFGPMDKTSESKLLDRRTQQEDKYYKDIMDRVKDADEIYIFGPAEAKTKLHTKIKKLKSRFPKVRAVESADSMTDNQKMAKVREVFAIKDYFRPPAKH
ncbi:MAG: hypothetical protein KJP00_09740 [Bacteroidia bacterium]|nr:hypothetical protein [Bacteroidia bacterium]